MKFPVMFFAAGLGTRMMHLTRDKPKPLIKVGDSTLIDHAMSFAQGDRFGPLVVNIHYKAEMLKAHLRNANVEFSDETEQLLETGGGLKKALPLLGSDTVATVNTDAVWSGANPLEVLAAAWTPSLMNTLLLIIPFDRAHGHQGSGDFVMDRDGMLRRGRDYIYTGAQITKTAQLADIPDDSFSMNALWNKVEVAEGLFGVVYPGNWCDVGHPSGIDIAERVLALNV